MDDPSQAALRFADAELLTSLVALLPPHWINVRHGEKDVPCPHVKSLVVKMLERALWEGWTIDRTNSDCPLDEWDGWLVIESPVPVFIQIKKPGGAKLV